MHRGCFLLWSFVQALFVSPPNHSILLAREGLPTVGRAFVVPRLTAPAIFCCPTPCLPSHLRPSLSAPSTHPTEYINKCFLAHAYRRPRGRRRRRAARASRVAVARVQPRGAAAAALERCDRARVRRRRRLRSAPRRRRAVALHDRRPQRRVCVLRGLCAGEAVRVVRRVERGVRVIPAPRGARAGRCRGGRGGRARRRAPPAHGAPPPPPPPPPPPAPPAPLRRLRRCASAPTSGDRPYTHYVMPSTRCIKVSLPPSPPSGRAGRSK